MDVEVANLSRLSRKGFAHFSIFSLISGSFHTRKRGSDERIPSVEKWDVIQTASKSSSC